jgi:hypothetical protein
MAVIGTQNLRARLIQLALAGTVIDVVYVVDPQTADAAPAINAVIINEVQADFVIFEVADTTEFLVPIDKIVTLQEAI